MNAQEKRIKLAELTGYVPFESPMTRGKRAWTPPEGGCFVWENELPDYCRDLNATNEIEGALDHPWHERFRTELWKLVAPREPFPMIASAPDIIVRQFISPTAEQRTTALINALS